MRLFHDSDDILILIENYSKLNKNILLWVDFYVCVLAAMVSTTQILEHATCLSWKKTNMVYNLHTISHPHSSDSMQDFHFLKSVPENLTNRAEASYWCFSLVSSNFFFYICRLTVFSLLVSDLKL